MPETRQLIGYAGRARRPGRHEAPLKAENAEVEKKIVGWTLIKVSHLNRLCWRWEEILHRLGHLASALPGNAVGIGSQVKRGHS